jgi:hypothetical protein
MNAIDVCRVSALAVVLFSFTTPQVIYGDEPKEARNRQILLKLDDLLPEQRGPVCGILAMKVAIESLGGSIELSQILSKRYLSDSRLGSSDLDLVRLATDHNMQTNVYRSLNISALQSLKSPALLHLKTRSDKRCGGHWVTFLGCENGRLIVYDSLKRGSLATIIPADLLTRWNGHTILVSRHPIAGAEKFNLGCASIVDRLFALLVCLTSVLSLVHFSNELGLIRKTISLLLGGIFAASVLQATDRNSIAYNWFSATWMTTPSIELDAASFEDFSRAKVAGNLVDARTAQAGKQLKVPGAVAIGVDWDLAEFRDGMERLCRMQQVVVFCNSRSCPWADNVGKRLKTAGFSDVRVFRRGIVGYLEEVSLQDLRAGSQ